MLMASGVQEKQTEGLTDQGQRQEWTEHSTLIFENLKPVQISNFILSSFKHLQKLYKFSKIGGCGSKIMHATPILVFQ